MPISSALASRCSARRNAVLMRSGVCLPERMIFSAKMKDQEINEQFADLFGGKNVFEWMKGVAPQNEQAVRDSLLKINTRSSSTP